MMNFGQRDSFSRNATPGVRLLRISYRNNFRLYRSNCQHIPIAAPAHHAKSWRQSIHTESTSANRAGGTKNGNVSRNIIPF